MKERRKRVVFLRFLFTILTMFLHGKNQKQSRGKYFHHNLVHGIVDHGKKQIVEQSVVSMAHESLSQGRVNSKRSLGQNPTGRIAEPLSSTHNK